MTSKLSIVFSFSEKLDLAIDEGIKAGEIKNRTDLLNRLAKVYQNELKRSNIIKPLKALDSDVNITVEIEE